MRLSHVFGLAALACAVLLIGCAEPRPAAEHQSSSPTEHDQQPAPAQTIVLPTPASQPEPSAVPIRTAGKAEPQEMAAVARNSTMARAYDMAIGDLRAPSMPVDREHYRHFDDNPLFVVTEDPVSTFSIDVDTAAYANVRRFLNQGGLPRADAVRTEELINYFDYAYAAPRDRSTPFSIHTELGVSPWNADRWLLHIGLKGFERSDRDMPAANLVFLIDVSGSMQSADKLELLKSSLKLLANRLRPQDRVSIAVYAGAAGTVLEPTAGDRAAAIVAALDALAAGGSTNGGAGIALAYNLARQHYNHEGINRVIIATDGDFNVGTVDQVALKKLIEQERESGVSLSVLGFGTGNYNDSLMQELAQAGNGNAAYIDTLNEGRKVLVDELASTLEVIAKDVKIQVEFNPAQIAEYRLVGYETRHLEREDFNNDKVDAGDIGAGHTVTALYELTPTGGRNPNVDPLRYQPAARPTSTTSELAFVRLRYKLPNEIKSRLIERAIASSELSPNSKMSADYRFSAAVAAFGQILRGARYTGDFDYDDVLELARSARGDDPFGYRGEFLGLVSTAAALAPRLADARPPE